jgi:hypothetical protein
MFLAIGGQAFAISKLAVPELDERDLPFYLDKPMHYDDTNLHLFSSLPLISRRRATAVFDFLRGPANGITSLLRLPIYPPVDVSLQPEFFDVTIWGQLSNLFQKNFALLAVEREIMALFEEIEELNARYMVSITAEPGSPSQAAKPPILDRRTYFQGRPEAEARREARSGKQLQAARTIKPMQNLRHLIQQHEYAEEPEHLTSQLAARVGTGRAPTLEAKASAAASMRVFEAQQDPRVTDTSNGNWMFDLFRLFNSIIRYLTQNKVEAIIYLWVLILLTFSMKALFQRS